jgi:hypothetical protein
MMLWITSFGVNLVVVRENDRIELDLRGEVLFQ